MIWWPDGETNQVGQFEKIYFTIWEKYTFCNLDQCIDVMTGTKQAADRSDDPIMQYKILRKFGIWCCLLRFWENKHTLKNNIVCTSLDSSAHMEKLWKQKPYKHTGNQEVFIVPFSFLSTNKI